MREHHVRDILIPEAEIRKRVAGLIDEIAATGVGENLIFIGILRGSFVFLADLVREIFTHGIHPKIDFLTLSSYHGGTESSGTVLLRKDFTVDVAGADVVVVEDILDTGRTYDFARRHIESKGAKTVRLCTLLNKPSRRVVPVDADFVGFEIEDQFVVGYGLDYDHYYRELPYVAKVTFTDSP